MMHAGPVREPEALRSSLWRGLAGLNKCEKKNGAIAKTPVPPAAHPGQGLLKACQEARHRNRVRTEETPPMLIEVVTLLLVSQQPMVPVTEGVASYYTVGSSSRTTASGERLRDNEYTCAMLDGQFGEYFLVVADNGNSVVVRLNDRGPYVKGRVIDLSRAAIRELHPSDGLLHVKVYPLGKNPPLGPLLN